MNSISSSSSSSSISNDPFNAVFNTFQKLLSNSASHDSRLEQKLAGHEEELDFSLLTEKKLQESILSRLNRIKKLRRFKLKRSTSEIVMGNHAMEIIESCSIQAVNTCLRNKNATTRCLHQHVLVAECRLRELTSDIVGEYSKSKVRFARRQDNLSDSATINLLRAVSKLRWRRFALKLCDKFSPRNTHSTKPQICGVRGSVSSKVLCPSNDRVEIMYITAAIARLSSDTHIDKLESSEVEVINVVKIYKKYLNHVKRIALRSAVTNTGTPLSAMQSVPFMCTQKERNINSANWNSCEPLDLFISTPRGFLKGIEHFHSWAESGRLDSLNQSDVAHSNLNSSSLLGSSSSNSCIHSSSSSELMSAAHIAWLQPASFYPRLWKKIMIDQRRKVCHRDVGKAGSGGGFNADADSCRYSYDKYHAADLNTSRDKEGDHLHDFVATFSLQHTSTSASDRIYYCLEEHALSTSMGEASADCAPVSASMDGGCTTSAICDNLQVKLRF